MSLSELRKRIAIATRQAFVEAKSSHGHEALYAFALYTLDDAVVVNPSLNTELAYQRNSSRPQSHTRSEEDRLGNERWSPYEWEYECEGLEFFRPVNEMINDRGQAIYNSDDANGFIEFKASVMASMVLALLDLESEKLFDRNAKSDAMTIFCSVPNSECTTWFEHDSARRLNSQSVFDRFNSERVAYLAQCDENFPPKDDLLYDKYLALIEVYALSLTT